MFPLNLVEPSFSVSHSAYCVPLDGPEGDAKVETLSTEQGKKQIPRTNTILGMRRWTNNVLGMTRSVFFEICKVRPGEKDIPGLRQG